MYKRQGADDKAGVAEIMTAAEQLISSDIPHGDIWIGFTPDEEVGHGADLFDPVRRMLLLHCMIGTWISQTKNMRSLILRNKIYTVR